MIAICQCLTAMTKAFAVKMKQDYVTILKKSQRKVSRMAEYHVGCGMFGIYAGILHNQITWKDKSEVTREALSASAQYMLINEKEYRFEYKGKWYVMRVEEMEGEQE